MNTNCNDPKNGNIPMPGYPHERAYGFEGGGGARTNSRA